MHLADMVLFWAQAAPEQPAIIQSDSTWTYREMAHAITAVSERLDALNFDRQEPVAVSISQPGKRLAVCLALLRQGISVAPVNQRALPFLRANGISNVIDSGEGQVLTGGRNVRFQDSWLRSKEASAAIKLTRVSKQKTIFFVRVHRRSEDDRFPTRHHGRIALAGFGRTNKRGFRGSWCQFGLRLLANR
jgi:non-ribosomal peptide synthetase component E (peptide arylation enzyme)